MKFSFVGFENIGFMKKRRLRKIALKWMSDQIVDLNEFDTDRVLNELRKFTIEVFPTSFKAKLYADLFNRSGTKTSDMIPWEVMGMYQLQLFIIDDKSEFMYSSAIMTLTHGLGHVLLWCFDRNRTWQLKVDDASGNKKGDHVSWHVAAVHNRTEAIEKTVQKTSDTEIENQIYYLQTFREFFPRIWRKVSYRVWDFRDDLR